MFGYFTWTKLTNVNSKKWGTCLSEVVLVIFCERLLKLAHFITSEISCYSMQISAPFGEKGIKEGETDTNILRYQGFCASVDANPKKSE